jgi:hypothetical protein
MSRDTSLENNQLSPISPTKEMIVVKAIENDRMPKLFGLK